MSVPVVLLRSPSTDGPDPYETALHSKGYAALSVPVLETTHVHLSELKRIVRGGPARHALSGVIITSARSCAAWRTVVEELVHDSDCSELPAAASESWAATPFYVVGHRTASSLLDISKAYGGLYAPRDVRGAEESGTAEALARFILRDLPPDGASRKLLYLTGDKNRDTLPNILRGGGVELHTLQVYGTQGSTTFERDLLSAIEPFPVDSRWWIVYFAPSAAEFATPTLRKYFHLPQVDGPTAPANERAARIAAIGPTTANFLRDELRILVHAVPAKPNPDELALKLEAADSLLG